MNRVKHCLNKMNELVNKPGEMDIIDLDLLLDYTKVCYAEILERRQSLVSSKFVNESILAYKEDTPKELPDLKPEDSSRPEPTIPQSEIQANKATSPPPKTQANSNTIPKPISEKVKVNLEQPSNQSKPPTPPSQPKAVLVDLRRLIPLNDKFAYVIELFNEGNEEYEDAINKLNLLDTYGATMDWVIANLQNRYNWDVENDLVQKFYEVIKSRFSRKS